MSDSTPRLRIPELVSLQEMNVATWNEALVQLDAFVDLYLLGQFVNTPPASPADGDAYLIGGTPTGAWSGYAYKIASCLDGAWNFYTPFNGLRAYVATTGAFIVYVNGQWTDWNSLISANEVSVASAASCDLGAAGSLFVQVTGTTTITSFGAGTNKLRFVRFAGALTLTHNATSLILLGGASRTTAAGDVGVYASDGSGNWRERGYFRAASNPGDYATKSGTETLTNKTLGATVVQSPYAGTDTTDAILAVRDSGSTLRTGLYANGTQSWFINSGSAETGRITYTFPGNNVGIAFFDAGLTVRSQIGFASASGGIGLGAGTGTGNPGYKFVLNTDGSVVPGGDNAQPFGSASLRWSVIYAASGTINTSGAATKTNVSVLSAAEIAVAKALAANVRVFQFCDAVAKKGADTARLHTGMIYEDVVAAFAAEGLDPLRYGILCRDPAMKTVTKTRTTRHDTDAEIEETYEEVEPDLDETGAQKWVLGLRYDELAQFVMAGLAARVAELEAK